MVQYSVFEMKPERYCYKHELPLSKEFKVYVGNDEIPVYTCRISKYPFNRPWPGHERPYDQTVEASFINLVGDGAVDLRVETGMDFDAAWVKPYSKEIPCVREGSTLNVSLKERGQYVLQCDNPHHMLYIFYSKTIPAPEERAVTYFFGPGIHFAGKIKLQSNESVYIDRDAYVYGNIFAENAENIRIFGNGILDGSMEARAFQHCYEEHTNGNLKFHSCKNITVEGVGMKEASCFCVNFYGCSDIYMNEIKIFGQWRYNNDGIDIVNTGNVRIENSLIHSFDDTISIKGIERYYYLDCCNIHVSNCVLWCDWGKCCELGAETICRYYRDISFTDCDILRAGSCGIDIAHRDCAEISDVRFENIHIDYNGFDTVEVLQTGDEQTYPENAAQAIPYFILFQNFCWRTHISYPYPPNVATGLLPIPDELDLSGVSSRGIHDVTVRNIFLHYDKTLPTENGKPILNSIIVAREHTPPYYNIHISGIYVNGQEIDIRDTNLEMNNVII